MSFDIQAKDEDTWLIEHVRSIISNTLPKLPPKEQRFGNSTVRWWEGKPGDAVIMAEGGTIDDRCFAEQLCKTQLEAHGFKRAQFVFHSEGLTKTAGWPDIMSKAKRLIQSGNVTMLRNGVNNIVAHVIGDHGEYNVEIGRDDPNSQSITTWQCECPWDQYAWGRTRQWKKYEGRPCAHVLAAYWKSKSTPLDDYNPDQHGPMPGQKIHPGLEPGMPGRPTAPLHGDIPEPPEEMGAPSVPGPPGAIKGPQIPHGPQMEPDAVGGPPNPLQQPLAPPGPPGILPPSPMEQLQMQQPPAPGQTPGGMPSPPGSVSVPGAKMPSPFNPIQYPGGTYSSMNWRSLEPEVRARIDQSGSAGGWDQNDCGERCAAWYAVLQEHGVPVKMMIEHANDADHVWLQVNGEIFDPAPELDPGVSFRRGYEVDPNAEWPSTKPYQRTSAAEYYPQQAVILKNNVWGQQEGKSEQHGAGQYIEVQARKPDGSPQHAEVLGQDPTTGWIEIIISNDSGGPLQPFLTRCYVEPSDITPARNSDPGFIRRH